MGLKDHVHYAVEKEYLFTKNKIKQNNKQLKKTHTIFQASVVYNIDRTVWKLQAICTTDSIALD